MDILTSQHPFATFLPESNNDIVVIYTDRTKLCLGKWGTAHLTNNLFHFIG